MTLIYSKSAQELLEIWPESVFPEGNSDGEFYTDFETCLMTKKTSLRSINSRINFELIGFLVWAKNNRDKVLIIK